MALWDEVAARYSDQILIELTNPQAGQAASVDTTRRDNAVADAQAEFKVVAQITYDNDDANHKRVGVLGVLAYLMSRGGTAAGIAKVTLEDFRAELRRLVKAGARHRVVPKTDSQLDPTDEFENRDTVRPDADRGRWDGLLLDNPRHRAPGDRDCD